MKTNQPGPDARNGDFDAIELAAADWLSRQEFGLSPVETAELHRWLEANPRHARVFRELQEAASVIERHPAALAEADAARTTRLHTSPPRLKRRARGAGWLAAAAVIAIGFFVVGRPAARHEKEYSLSASTAVGSLRVLALPDGSTVRLNTDSALAVHFTLQERRVKLTRGEASFTVAKSAARPFYVEVSGVAVRAVGTEFVVRLRADTVDILVTEGQVRVEDAKADSLLPGRNSPAERGATAAEPLLSAGEQVRVPLGDATPQPALVLASVGPKQIARALAWQERRLIFEGTPLSEVVAEFNRYSRQRLVIEDDALGRQQFGGTFRADRHETLVSLLEQSFDVMAERRGNTTYLRRRSP